MDMIKVKRIGIIKTAGFMGVFGLFMGIIGVLIAMLILKLINLSTVPLIGGIGGGPALQSTTLAIKWQWIVLVPLINAVISFIATLILVPIANLALWIIRGINFDLDIDIVPQVQVMNAQKDLGKNGASAPYSPQYMQPEYLLKQQLKSKD